MNRTYLIVDCSKSPLMLNLSIIAAITLLPNPLRNVQKNAQSKLQLSSISDKKHNDVVRSLGTAEDSSSIKDVAYVKEGG